MIAEIEDKLERDSSDRKSDVREVILMPENRPGGVNFQVNR
jgi:hypothetical protein